MEGADEVLALGEIDRGLAADRGVDLADEGARHGDPGDAAEIGRGSEARDVGRAAAAERDDRAAAIEPQLAPEALDDRDRLRLLPGRQIMRRDEAVAERFLGPGAVDAHHRGVRDECDWPVAGDELGEPVERTQLVMHTTGRQDGAVCVTGDGVGDLAVDRATLLIEPPERCLVLGKRTLRAAHALPGEPDVDVDQDGEGVARERVPDRRHGDRAASEGGDHRFFELQERRVLRFELAKRSLSLLREDLGDRPALRPLDLLVRVDERTTEAPRHFAGDGRLSGAHEPHEREVPVQRVLRQVTLCYLEGFGAVHEMRSR